MNHFKSERTSSVKSRFSDGVYGAILVAELHAMAQFWRIGILFDSVLDKRFNGLRPAPLFFKPFDTIGVPCLAFITRLKLFPHTLHPMKLCAEVYSAAIVTPIFEMRVSNIDVQVTSAWYTNEIPTVIGTGNCVELRNALIGLSLELLHLEQRRTGRHLACKLRKSALRSALALPVMGCGNRVLPGRG